VVIPVRSLRWIAIACALLAGHGAARAEPAFAPQLEGSIGGIDGTAPLLMALHLGGVTSGPLFVGGGLDLRDTSGGPWARSSAGLSVSLGLGGGRLRRDGGEDDEIGTRLSLRLGAFVASDATGEVGAEWTRFGTRASLGITSGAWAAHCRSSSWAWPLSFANHVEVGFEREDFAERERKAFFLVGVGY